MSVKKIPDSQLINFVNLSNNAYPAFSLNTQEEKEKLVQRLSSIQNEVPNENLYGYYRDDELLGGMKIHDFKMNMLSHRVDVGGVGMVAVDFLHKKEQIAKELILYFLDHLKEKKYFFAALYPFRPDFYKKMGFGYGTKINQYTIKPNSFYKSDLRKYVSFLTENDKDLIKNCYNLYMSNHNGMFEMTDNDYNNLFKNPRLRVVGYKNKDELEGYMIFSFKSDDKNFILTDITIHKLIYNTQTSLMGLNGFLNSQSDQIRNVILNTQDDNYHFNLFDPRNNTNHLIPHVYHESNVQGVGLMYRVLDTHALFKGFERHNFNNVSLKLKLTIKDDFYLSNDGSIYIEFVNGFPTIVEDENYDVEVKLDISDFSSLFMGVIDFKSLYQYSLAQISDERYLNLVNNLFKTDKPICMTEF